MVFKIEDFTQKDIKSVLKLNQRSQPHLSHLTYERLSELVEFIFHFRVIKYEENVVAFLMGMEEDQPYDSVNYIWMSNYCKSFYYIDRIAVRENFQFQGLGKALYNDSQFYAILKKKPIMACEVNIIPPNPESIRFHHRLGFHPVGEQNTERGNKRVQYMVKNLTGSISPTL